MKLNEIKERTGWSQEKIAELLFVDQSQVSKILKGERGEEGGIAPSKPTEAAIDRLYSRVILRKLALRGFTEQGGTCHLKDLGDGTIQRGAKNLSQEQMDAYKKASLVADYLNGGNWEKAEKLLKEAGFEVLYE
jgi:hypothetical protein